jgi:hypothetical protein
VVDEDLPDFRTPPTARDQTWSGSHPCTVCFGDRCVPGRLREVFWGLNSEQTLTVTFLRSDLATHGPDLATTVRIYRSADVVADAELISTSYVDEAVWDADGAEARVKTSPMVSLKAMRITGLATEGIAPQEVVYALLRLAGVAPAKIRIGGDWSPSPETFFVVVPVEGLRLDFPQTVGDVTFTPDPGLRRQWEAGKTKNGAEHAFVADFQGTDVAAVTKVRAALVVDAEQIGLQRIEAAVAQLAVAARFSSALGQTGRARNFQRTQLHERVRLRRVVGVLSKDSLRQWIRGVDSTVDSPLIRTDDLAGMTPALEAQLDGQLRESLRAWRRASISPDPAAAVTALVEALEFYVGKTTLPGPFEKVDLARARNRLLAPSDWTVEQRNRLEDVLALANEAPFFLRLLAAASADGFPLTHDERGLLHALRVRRNDMLHGRERIDPGPDELTMAVALVARMLAARFARVAVAEKTADA